MPLQYFALKPTWWKFSGKMKKAKISNIFCIQPVESHKKISVKLQHKSYIIKWFTVLQLFLRGNKYWLIFAKFVLKDYWLILSKFVLKDYWLIFSKFVLKDYRKKIQLKTGLCYIILWHWYILQKNIIFDYETIFV
jgi:hypothetical protein